MTASSIIIVSDGFPPERTGGAERIALYSALALMALGWRVSVVTFNDESDREYTIDGVSVKSWFRKSYPFYWRTYLNILSPSNYDRIREHIVVQKPEHILIHNAHHYVTLALWHFLLNRYPTSIVLHDVMHIAMSKVRPSDTSEVDSQFRKISTFELFRKYRYLYNPIYFALIKKLLAKSNVLAVSEALARFYRANGVEVQKAVRNGIPDVLPPDGQTAPFPDLTQKRFILHIGRLSGLKGTEQAVKAHMELVERYPGLILVLAGNKKEGEEFKLVSRYPGLVQCVGWVDETATAWLYQNAVCVLNISLYLDPFPTTNLEAYMHSCPVIGSCFGGTPEVIKDGQDGFIVNPYRTVEIVDAVKKLLDDKALRARFAAAARSSYEKKFTLVEYGKRLEHALHS